MKKSNSLLERARRANGQGRALIKLNDTVAGIACLDEAMVAIEAGEVSSIIAGNVYCSTIEACTEIFDVRRAQEWTASLARWCEAQPGPVWLRQRCPIQLWTTIFSAYSV